MRRAIAVLLTLGLLMLAAPATAPAATSPAAGATTKLVRGGVNLATGWVELPKRITETTNANGAFAGWTGGLLRGLGYGFVRTVAGAYELVTFPFPAPPRYAPVIQPEFVFND